jgi:DNA replication protein DnaC
MYREESDDLSYTRAYVRDEILAKVPPRFAAAETDNAAALRWLDGCGGTLYIFGPTGSGKTHIAWALYRRYAKLGIGVARFWQMPALVDDLRPGGNDQAMERAVSAGLLILDDVAAAKLSDWAHERLLMIADSRWANMRPTVITGNLRPADLGGHVGDQVASRWAHDVTTIRVVGADRRRA